jgi:hypothetical protein
LLVAACSCSLNPNVGSTFSGHAEFELVLEAVSHDKGGATGALQAVLQERDSCSSLDGKHFAIAVCGAIEWFGFAYSKSPAISDFGGVWLLRRRCCVASSADAGADEPTQEQGRQEGEEANTALCAPLINWQLLSLACAVRTALCTCA